MTNEEIHKAANAYAFNIALSMDRGVRSLFVSSFIAGAHFYRDEMVKKAREDYEAWEGRFLAEAVDRIHVSPKDLIAAKDARIAQLEAELAKERAE